MALASGTRMREVVVFNHGAAPGADRQADRIARRLGFFVLPHPAGDDPLGRNRVIVRNAKNGDIGFTGTREGMTPAQLRRVSVILERAAALGTGGFLIGAPLTMIPLRRSGTWATMRYAQADDVRIMLAWPDGSYDLDYTGDVG